MKTVAYIRVSTKDQNLQRQLDEMKKFGIEDKYIYEDKTSGKDMDRIGYQYMKKSLESGDTLVIKSLDRLGRNQNDIKTEWQYFKDNKINVRVLDMPALNIDYSKGEAIEGLHSMISNIVFEVISWQAEEERTKIRQRQREGIESAKNLGKHLGRPQLNLNTITKYQRQVLENNYKEWKAKKITGVEFAELLELKKNSFYKIVKEYENTLN
ncbi:recombinase family protein [Ureibacillus acetophenoni]|uniref:DNA invertase Pin-like site-specific DNA recombinase n=1 Tax=Ureibacillus acetophenoni TaxID=614649 RepID=A0A285UNY6_9BACL|nr:recombinase family protein [Ureibacillus acetophenoni]SOC43417.1 DNA invertase Pin-like site-specific DNA recombinase [Ureibacillus acetophenoni]